MTNRRDALKTLGLLTGTTWPPQLSFGKEKKKPAGKFKFCLNTSTISGQKPGLQKTIDIAARAGYDSVELWVPEIKAFKEGGNSLKTLKKLLDDSIVTVEDAIAFEPCRLKDDTQAVARI